ncbi:LysR family transcriptional regulator [Pseudonocardia sp. GCM10023141]|uniref:LysR family transcriptional regulator n=1 Tax=Pseudonocardia sp. GCM10023141 TaxID=3252653 RepID=UPI00360F408C
MTIELRHLRCFLAIAEDGSITRAAARLHLGQPALSRTLRQLEQHLGLRLIDRSTHHLELTAAGLAFRARARTALAAVDDALDPSRLGVWPLRLGWVWSALGDRTAALLQRWREAHPDVGLELVRGTDRTAGLEEGRVDAVLLRGAVPPGLQSALLHVEPRLAAVPAGDPLARRRDVTLADLADHPVVVDRATGTTTAALWPPRQRPDTVVVTSLDEWLITIADGRGVGVTAAATPELHPFPGVAYVPLVGVAGIPVQLAWTDPPTHPGVPDLLAVARAVVSRP